LVNGGDIANGVDIATMVGRCQGGYHGILGNPSLGEACQVAHLQNLPKGEFKSNLKDSKILHMQKVYRNK
jgi:hypothetical protein